MILQALLADRFKLAVRRVTKEMSVYALVLAKHGSTLTELKRDPTDEDGNFRMAGGSESKM